MRNKSIVDISELYGDIAAKLTTDLILLAYIKEGHNCSFGKEALERDSKISKKRLDNLYKILTNED